MLETKTAVRDRECGCSREASSAMRSHMTLAGNGVADAWWAWCSLAVGAAPMPRRIFRLVHIRLRMNSNMEQSKAEFNAMNIIILIGYKIEFQDQLSWIKWIWFKSNFDFFCLQICNLCNQNSQKWNYSNNFQWTSCADWRQSWTPVVYVKDVQILNMLLSDFVLDVYVCAIGEVGVCGMYVLVDGERGSCAACVSLALFVTEESGAIRAQCCGWRRCHPSRRAAGKWLM